MQQNQQYSYWFIPCTVFWMNIVASTCCLRCFLHLLVMLNYGLNNFKKNVMLLIITTGKFAYWTLILNFVSLEKSLRNIVFLSLISSVCSPACHCFCYSKLIDRAAICDNAFPTTTMIQSSHHRRCVAQPAAK